MQWAFLLFAESWEMWDSCIQKSLVLYQSLPQLSSQLWYFLQQKNRENSPMNTWDRGTTNCCPIITQTSSAQVKQGCEKTHPEASLLLYSRGKSEHHAGFGECPGDPSNLLQLCPQTGHGGVQRLLWAHYQRASQHSRGWRLAPGQDRASHPASAPSTWRGIQSGKPGRKGREGDRRVCWTVGQINADTEGQEGESFPGYNNNNKKIKIKSELCFERVKGVCASTFRFPVRIPCAVQT